MNTSDEYAVHELWKQIPEAERPAGLAWHDVLECFTGDVEIADSMGHDGSGGIFKVKMHPEAVSMLLEASMMRRLHAKAIVLQTYWQHQDGMSSVQLFGAGCPEHLFQASYTGASMVEALAAACKAVGT